MLEAVQPSLYPTLHRVLLLESRHSTRTESRKALKAAGLFEEIVEPDSLSEGLTQLNTLEFDACVIGSSVKRDKAQDFLTKAKAESLSKDCAFIVLVSDGDEAVIMSEADQTIRWPSTRQEFFRGIIFGVVKANANSPWASIVKGERSEEAATAGASERQTLSLILSGEGLVDLQGIAERIMRKELGLGPDGRPDVTAELALSQIVEKIFSTSSQSPKIVEFRDYFSNALELWFVESVRYSVEIGTNNLRRSLLAWAE